MFRYKKSIDLGYERQGYIYFTSVAFQDLPEWKQEEIRRHCVECGGEYADALFEFVTTPAGATQVCMRHYLSESTLSRAVKKYYESFPKKL